MATFSVDEQGGCGGGGDDAVRTVVDCIVMCTWTHAHTHPPWTLTTVIDDNPM